MANMTRRGEPREGLAGPMAPLRALDPFRVIRDLMSGDPFAGTVPAQAESFAPDIQVKETKDAYEITADLPGVREQDIDIAITGDRLTLSGKREEERRQEDDRFYVYERSYGTFSRSFALPDGADFNKVKAELRDGVLHISIPKKAEMQSRRVEVSKGAGAGELPTGRQEQKKEEGAKEKEGAAQKPAEKKAA